MEDTSRDYIWYQSGWTGGTGVGNEIFKSNPVCGVRFCDDSGCRFIRENVIWSKTIDMILKS